MNEKRIQELLRAAVPPVGDTVPRRDLWPAMRARLEAGQPNGIRLGAWEWALAAALVAAILFLPVPILGIFCQL